MQKEQPYKNWLLTYTEENILWLSLDRAHSKVNSLNEEVLLEFDHILTEISENPQLKALIIQSAKKTGFIVGADITQFENIPSAKEALQFISKGQAIYNRLEQLPIITIALIEGFCLGGGLELALACQYRIAENSAKTRLGLPEVKLGIQPGWGGTIRLPKLVGPLKAMDLILTGKTITAKTAKKLGLVNEAVPKRLLKKAALSYALIKQSQKKSPLWDKVMAISLARQLLGRVFIHQLQKKIQQEHYPAPYKVVENWIEYGVESKDAMKIEAESIANLLMSETSRNLVRVFFLQEQLKTLGKANKFKPPHVHVIGAGVMGGDIAAWCALRGFHVTLQDQAPKLIGNAIKRAYELATKVLKEKNLIQEMMDRLIPDIKGQGIANADIILEAITEKLIPKQELFLQLEQQAKAEAILATNTSTIPLEEISVVLTHPERLIGIHFFNPVAKMPLVEIVHGAQTDPQIIDKALAFCRSIDKLPLPVKSSPGFLVNRILLPYMLEAVLLVEEGVAMTDIDRAAVEFGMPMGPIELADAVGLDICLAALNKLAPMIGATIPTKLQEYVARGELGRKTGKGFYQYKKGRALKPATNQTHIATDLTSRLILRLLNEAMACLREKIVHSADLLDAGCIFGFGFAPFRGGPMNYIKAQGKTKLLAEFAELAERYGKRFKPDEYWQSIP